ncbi:MAG: ribosome-binding ATPase YchF [Patescibacteria group bacterium]|nr:MAG: ribosome-binding ATPase YchF [Patescibacteria group bacterium]
MKLSIGIVGLPNVGKSTLFNALLKKQVADVANYPFCTIEPNVGVVEVPDERLPVLGKIVNTQKIIPAVVEFYDIAGLVKGASEGQGLGNKFLSHIREVAAIAHVVRFFDDKNVAHVSDKINPADDIKTIETELILADLQSLEKIKNKKAKTDSENLKVEIAKILSEKLNQGIPVINIQLSDEEKQVIKEFNLLTAKPVIYVFNVSENQLEKKSEIEEKIKTIFNDLQLFTTNYNYLYLSAKLESEIVILSDEEQKQYLKQYGLEESGLNRLIKQAYKTLGLISFLTAGEKEVRAWTIKKGTLAPQAAGVIHSDFEKHFIKADVIPYEKFVDVGGWINAREQGLVQTVGKDYEIKDGDVVEFKVNI